MISIVDYGMGNLESIRNMIRKIGGNAELVNNPAKLEHAKALILPGVGHFGKAMQLLKEKGFLEVLNHKAQVEKIPVHGICLGMQLLMEHSEEGDANGLAWIEGEVKKFQFEDKSIKIPHMGWSETEQLKPDLLFEGYQETPRFYFVHSYYVSCSNPENVIARADYGIKFDCAVRRENISGTQFHPEKSHKFGMHMLSNFINSCKS